MTETAAASQEAAHHKGFTIIVNAEQKIVDSVDVSYEEVVRLAYPTPPSPDTLFTVSFRNGKRPPEGSLIAGQSVEVKKTGTIFNVKPTGKS